MLTRLPNFIKAFGVGAGLAKFARVHGRRRAPGTVFAVPLGRDLLWLRATPSDTSIFFQVLVKREYDTSGWTTQHVRLARRYRDILAAGRTPVIIDAGANIGCASIWFAECYPEARIFAVEPDAGNLVLLRRNCARLANVMVIDGAVWDRPCRLGITNPGAGAGAFRVVEDAGEIVAHTVPELLARVPDAEPLIVKIDIEGGEAALFRTSTEWAREAGLIAVETHDWLFPGAGTSNTLLRCIAELPIDLLFRGENLFCFRHDQQPVGSG